MAVEANDKNVRSRIDAIIDARERSNASKRRRKISADKKPLVITLSILCVIIAGLVIAILAVSRPWDGGDEEGATCGGNGNETSEQRDDRIAEKISEVAEQANGMSFDEAIEYLDREINNYAGSEYEYGIRMVKIYLLLNNGESSEALEEAKKIDAENGKLDEEQLLDYYNIMMRIYGELGDDTMMIYYQDAYSGMYRAVHGEDKISDED